MEAAPDKRYRELPSTLASVDALWRFDAGEAVTTLVPADGCADLIVRVAPGGEVDAFVYQPSAHAHEALVEKDARFAGIRLRPGYGGALLAKRDFASRVAEERWQRGGELSELEATVGELLDHAGDPPALVRDFVELSAASQGAARLSGMSASHERGLQRAAQKWLGMTPKAFLRIERVRAAREAIRAGWRLAEVAAEFGYADQAHLTREVRELLGVTPRELRPVGILQDRGERDV